MNMQDRQRIFYKKAHGQLDSMEADIRKLEDLVSSAMTLLRNTHIGHEERARTINEAAENIKLLGKKQAIIDFIRSC